MRAGLIRREPLEYGEDRVWIVDDEIAGTEDDLEGTAVMFRREGRGMVVVVRELKEAV